MSAKVTALIEALRSVAVEIEDAADTDAAWEKVHDALRAVLIAEAAPDLLAALRDLVERCDGEEGVRSDGSNIQTMRAHAAIAKATNAQ